VHRTKRGAFQLAALVKRTSAMKTLRGLAALVMLACATGAATAHDFHAGAIGVDRAVASPSTIGQRETPAFMTITNSGKADALVGATCSAAKSVELHNAMPTDAGTTMRTLSAIPIPANGTLDLTREGYHIVFISLNHSFTAGDRIAATLRFSSGTELAIEFQIGETMADTPADAK
jgi:periplasmic copper chaperone A